MDRKGDKREPAVMVRTLGKRNVGGFVFRKKAPKPARRRAAGSAAADTAAPDADAAPAAEGVRALRADGVPVSAGQARAAQFFNCHI